MNTLSIHGLLTIFFVIYLFAIAGCTASSDGRNIWQMIDDYDHVAIQKWIEKKGDISSAGLLKPPPALYALEMGNTKCYQEILKGRPDLSVTYGLRKRAVMTVAASKSDSFWLREAIKYGGNVNFDDHGSKYNRYTPLVYAAYAGSLENTKLLVEAGADIELCLDGYTTALPTAAISGNYDIALYLLENGADYRRRLKGFGSLAAVMQNKDPKSVRSEKLRDDMQRVIDWLAERGIDINRTHWEGEYLVWTEE